MNRFICLTLLLCVSAAAQNSQVPHTTHPTSPQSSPTTVSTDTIPVIPGINEIAGPAKGPARIAREVRHELLMLPYYTLFDDLRFRVNGSTVELLGDVVNPSLKTQAEKAVKDIEGVEQVQNHINILPPSPADDRIRHAVARAVFSADGLSRYSWEAAPTIHIVVSSGRVRLVGVVSNAGDKNIAGIQANSVPGVFSVSNELIVQPGV